MAIARRRLADAARCAARRNAYEIVGETRSETFREVPANMEQESRDDAMALRQALVVLAPAQREALELLKLQGLSLQEASAASGKSVAALKVAMHRALNALRLVFTGDA